MAAKRPRQIAEVVQRALLGAAMTVVVFVVERQLSRRMGQPPPRAPDAPARDQERAR